MFTYSIVYVCIFFSCSFKPDLLCIQQWFDQFGFLFFFPRRQFSKDGNIQLDSNFRSINEIHLCRLGKVFSSFVSDILIDTNYFFSLFVLIGTRCSNLVSLSLDLYLTYQKNHERKCPHGVNVSSSSRRHLFFSRSLLLSFFLSLSLSLAILWCSLCPIMMLD